jgi:hypothetical protein
MRTGVKPARGACPLHDTRQAKRLAQVAAAGAAGGARPANPVLSQRVPDDG